MADDKDLPQDPPADKKPAEKPKEADKPAPPPTVADVKKTPLKHPSVIALEKKVSELEDKTDTLESALGEVNTFLEGLQIGGPSPVPINQKGKGKGAAPATGGAMDEIDRLIWGH